MELEFGAYTVKGIQECGNQDHYRLLGNSVSLVNMAGRGQIFGVFDGMGSTPKAAEASMHVGQRLKDFFKAQKPPCATQISELLWLANNEINDWGYTDHTRMRHQGGCAGTVAWLHSGLHIFHAGDTRALLLRAEGQAIDGYDTLTIDHSEGNVLHNYFGRGNDLKIEQRSMPVAVGDILVLMTDGVTNVFRGSDIATQVRTWIFGKNGSADLAARNLCELARDRGSRDDITSVIVEIESL